MIHNNQRNKGPAPDVFSDNNPTPGQEPVFGSSGITVEPLPEIDPEVQTRRSSLKAIGDLRNGVSPDEDVVAKYSDIFQANKQSMNLLDETSRLNDIRYKRTVEAAQRVSTASLPSSELTQQLLQQKLLEESQEPYPEEKNAAESLFDLWQLNGEEVDPERLADWEELSLNGGWETAVEITRRKFALAQIAENVSKNAEERNGLLYALDFAFFLLPLIDSTARTHNVPGAEKAKWWEQVFAGTQQNQENALLFSMNLSPEQFNETAKQVELNLKAGTTDFGYHNVLQNKILASELVDTPSAAETNAWNAVDAAALLGPALRAGKAITTPLKMVRQGGNVSEGVEMISAALKASAEEGAAGLEKKLGIKVEDLVDEIEPGLAKGANEAISSGVEGIERYERGQKLAKDLDLISKDLDRLTPDELEEAIQGTIKEFEQGTGYKVKDYRLDNPTEGSGVKSNVLKVYVGKKDYKGGFANKLEAMKLGERLGVGSSTDTAWLGSNIPHPLISRLNIDGVLRGPNQDPMIRLARDTLGQNNAGTVIIDPSTSELKGLMEQAKKSTVAPVRGKGGKFKSQKEVKILATPDGNIIAGIADSHESLARSLGLSAEDLGKGYYNPDKVGYKQYLDLGDLRGSFKSFKGQGQTTFRLADEPAGPTAEVEEGLKMRPVRDLDTGHWYAELSLPGS